jgi:hypothetical protein
MSLPSGESADDPAINGTDHKNSKKEAFLIGSTREGRYLFWGMFACIGRWSSQFILNGAGKTLRVRAYCLAFLKFGKIPAVEIHSRASKEFGQW